MRSAIGILILITTTLLPAQILRVPEARLLTTVADETGRATATVEIQGDEQEDLQLEVLGLVSSIDVESPAEPDLLRPVADALDGACCLLRQLPRRAAPIVIRLRTPSPVELAVALHRRTAAGHRQSPALLQRCRDALKEINLDRGSLAVFSSFSGLWNEANKQRDHHLSLIAARAASPLANGDLSDDPQFAVATELRLSIAWRGIGHLDEAAAAAGRGLDLINEKGGPSTVANEALLALGVGDLELGRFRYVEAVSHFERLVRVQRARFGLAYKEEHRDLGLLGTALSGCRRYEEAEVVLARARELALIREGELGETTAMIERELSTLEQATSRTALAHQRLEDLLARYEAKGATEAMGYGRTLQYLTRFYGEELLQRDAKRLADRSLEWWTRRTGPLGPEVGTAQVTLGSVAFSMGDLDASFEHYRRAYLALLMHYGPDHLFSLTARGGMATARLEKGELDEARAHYEAIVASASSMEGGQSLTLTSALQGLAFVEFRQGKIELARARLLEAIAIREADPSRRGVVLLHALRNLAAFEDNVGDLLAGYAASHRAAEEARRLLAKHAPQLSEASRLEIAATHRAQLDHLVNRWTRLEVKPPIADLYSVVLGWKGLVARGLLAQKLSLLDRGDRASDERLEELRELISKPFLAEDPSATAVHAAALAERERIERELFRRKLDAEWTATPTLEALMARLGPKRALVDFLVCSDYRVSFTSTDGTLAEGRVYAFVLGPGAPIRCLDLGPARALHDAIELHLQVTRRSTKAGSPGSEKHSLNLAELLWEPIEAVVQGAEEVFICAEGSLGLVPFETIPDGAGDRFLIERYGFHYLQSAQDLVLERHPLPRGRAILVGGIEFGDPPAGSSGPAFDPLPSSKHEVDDIEALALKAEISTASLSGRKATHASLSDLVVGAEWLHLATHGSLDPLRARESRRSFVEAMKAGSRFQPTLRVGSSVQAALVGARLALSGANERAGQTVDGLLTADEASWLDLRSCRLVVLSACETGLGSLDAGEELIGLRRAFRLAGARGTIAALWKIEDQATRNLMNAFYRRLWIEKLPAGRALRATQLEFLNTSRKETGAPRQGLWGAFIFEGYSE